MNGRHVKNARYLDTGLNRDHLSASLYPSFYTMFNVIDEDDVGCMARLHSSLNLKCLEINLNVFLAICSTPLIWTCKCLTDEICFQTDLKFFLPVS